MEVYVTSDNEVYKYIHDDGSETAIKLNGSCSSDTAVKNKYSVFISSSVGCSVSCNFCYLTTKCTPYIPLTEEQIVSNVMEAIRHFVGCDEKKRKQLYLKVSWMGMGDALFSIEKTLFVTHQVIRNAYKEKLCMGVDGVDIGTALPIGVTTETLLDRLILLDSIVRSFNVNPARNGAPVVRVFYSLHGGTDMYRKRMIPSGLVYRVEEAHRILSQIPRTIGLVAHVIFINRINDDGFNANAIASFVNSIGCELRVLRFNKCERTIYEESSLFNDLVEYLSTIVTTKLKIQVSAGSEISASCGQFLSKVMEEKNDN